MRKIVLKLKPAKAFGDEDYFVDEKNDPILCRKVLGEFFTLPKNKTTPINFVISGKKTPDSYEVKFDSLCHPKIYYGKKWHEELLVDEAEYLASQLNLDNEKVWVTLYWEE